MWYCRGRGRCGIVVGGGGGLVGDVLRETSVCCLATYLIAALFDKLCLCQREGCHGDRLNSLR